MNATGSPDPFEIVTTRSGAVSIRCVELNQTMHGSVGPWEEANALYVRPSRLTERLATAPNGDLVLFDVGLGAAANALAAMHAATAMGEAPRRRLRVVSFERDLRLLEFAFANAATFSHFEGFHDAIAAILADRHWESPCGRILWELRVGNFLDMIAQETARPDIIFHDPYSPAANPEMWDVACFEQLRALAKTDGEATTLFTYSCATPVRAALLLAGFFVGLGPSTGRMRDTTQASTRVDALASPFGERWFSRWERSHTKYPLGTSEEARADVTARMLGHPQFSSRALRLAADQDGEGRGAPGVSEPLFDGRERVDLQVGIETGR